MIWLEQNESIVIEHSVLVSLLSISHGEARLGVTVHKTSRVHWTETPRQSSEPVHHLSPGRGDHQEHLRDTHVGGDSETGLGNSGECFETTSGDDRLTTVTVTNIRDGMACLEIEGPMASVLIHRIPRTADPWHDPVDFSHGNSVFLNRRKNEQFLVEMQRCSHAATPEAS
jgi:hypothetical protein